MKLNIAIKINKRYHKSNPGAHQHFFWRMPFQDNPGNAYKSSNGHPEHSHPLIHRKKQSGNEYIKGRMHGAFNEIIADLQRKKQNQNKKHNEIDITVSEIIKKKIRDNTRSDEEI